jgi:hypothetical protein
VTDRKSATKVKFKNHVKIKTFIFKVGWGGPTMVQEHDFQKMCFLYKFFTQEATN